jgi:hypothetical protein
MNERYLSRLGFDLAYLTLLTRYNIKRLSRWEGKLSSEKTAILRDSGLEVTGVRRKLRFGRKTDETVFALKSCWTEFYRSRFDMTRITESPEEVRLKGFLFGYPSCCIEAFIQKPYARNDLRSCDQKILFHWACPGCKVTPSLVRDYRAVYAECASLFGHERLSSDALPIARHQGGIRPLLALQRRALPASIGLSALLLFPQVGNLQGGRVDAAPLVTDPHVLPVEDDADSDYLSFGEEILSGNSMQSPDTDGDGVPDGIARAYAVGDLVGSLPQGVQPDRCYRLDHCMDGVEYCEICGASIDMGFVEIVNPMRGSSMNLPFMCLHYLEHGGLSYLGTIHSGRLDYAQLKRILLATDESHPASMGCCQYEDTDDDELCTEEEIFLETDPTDADTDGDSVKDGPQFVEGLLEALSMLPREVTPDGPYLSETLFHGVETCEVCGDVFNMGYVTVTNPLEGISLDIPCVALHYLAHGSTSYNGTVNDGRVLPILLQTALNGDGTAHWLAIEDDTDGDGLKDEEEAYFDCDPAVSDTDADGTPDGPQLAMVMHDAIALLPEGPHPDSTYVLHNLTCGIYQCLTCNEDINMGFMDVVNPQTGASVQVPYYNFHFMQHGSFATDRPTLYPRIDPRDIGGVIGLSSGGWVPGTPQAPAALKVFPNPFRGQVYISWNVPAVPGMRVAVYDARGRRVRDISSELASGKSAVWDGTDSEGERLTPGVYFCKVELGEITLSRKVVLLE